jgi:hypothetical protein
MKFCWPALLDEVADEGVADKAAPDEVTEEEGAPEEVTSDAAAWRANTAAITAKTHTLTLDIFRPSKLTDFANVRGDSRVIASFPG